MSINIEELSELPISVKQLITTAGVWMDGKTFWLNHANERILPNELLTIQLKREYIHSKIHYFECHITNHSSEHRNALLLFMNQLQNPGKDYFSFISPSDNVIYHYDDDSVYLVNGQINGEFMGQRTIQPYWNFYNDRIWNDIDKGTLNYLPMVKGSAVSIFSLDMNIPPNRTVFGSAWVIFDKNKSEIIRLNQSLIKMRLAFPFKK